MSDEQLGRQAYDAFIDHAISRNPKEKSDAEHWSAVDSEIRECFIFIAGHVRKQLEPHDAADSALRIESVCLGGEAA